ncbi:MAG: LysR substrate-binding domain-containing protein [Rhodospirillales bacterium]|nr:LysR family transcriptional regulator [Alphaproteobacteria bacterium HT1-32]|tara:strand:+ start:28252 stop:29145 length:894 start_codon:yes stop_codon:yes gene_type:complete
MSVRYLRTFIAIAESGTFASAAHVVGITQSAVSMQMRALEDELRCELFDRTKRPPTLNAYGKALLPKAREIVFLYDQMTEAASSRDALAGMLELGAVPTTLTGLLPRTLAGLRTRHPRLKVRIAQNMATELIHMVDRGEIDAAIVSEAAQTPPGLRVRPFASEQLMVVAPLDAPYNTDVELLEKLPYIRFSRHATVGRMIQRELRNRNIKVSESMELASMEAITQMVYHGLGVSVLPERSVEEPRPLPIKKVPFGSPPPERVLALVEREESPKTPLIDAVFVEIEKLVGGSRSLEQP